MDENYIYVYKLPNGKHICFVSLRSRDRADELAHLLTGFKLEELQNVGKLDPDEEGTFIFL